MVWFRGCLILAVVFLCAVPGCSRSAPPAAAESETEDTPAGSDMPASAGEETSSSAPKKPVEIAPEDVFFPDPLAIANQNQGAAAAPAVAVAKPVAVKPQPAASEEKPAAAAGGNWSQFLTGATLTEETKKSRLRVKDSVSTVSKYNGNYKEIQVDAAVLAALATIAPSLEDAPSWKDKAKFVREVASEMGSKSTGLGQSNYDPTRTAYEKLDSLLSGNNPAELPEAADAAPFASVARRGPLMRRMDRAFQFLSSTIKTEATFKQEAEAIAHEGAMLATLTRIISEKEYDSADEEDYQKFIKSMLEASQGIVESVKADSFMNFESALSKTKRACDECHADFRFGG